MYYVGHIPQLRGPPAATATGPGPGLAAPYLPPPSSKQRLSPSCCPQEVVVAAAGVERKAQLHPTTGSMGKAKPMEGGQMQASCSRLRAPRSAALPLGLHSPMGRNKKLSAGGRGGLVPLPEAPCWPHCHSKAPPAQSAAVAVQVILLPGGQGHQSSLPCFVVEATRKSTPGQREP